MVSYAILAEEQDRITWPQCVELMGYSRVFVSEAALGKLLNHI